VVLDDAVVYDRNVARSVRVCVGFAWAAVSGPPCVTDSGCSGQRLLPKGRVEVLELPDSANDFDASAGVDGKPCGVIPTILESAQPFDEDGGAVL
jgi:hypothetical protein